MLTSVALIISLFLPWFSLTRVPERVQQGDWICGVGEHSCTAWSSLPILRWLLLAAAVAPLILAWIVVRGHTLSWPPGELTMIVGMAAIVLIGFNGVISRPGDFGIGLDYGYIVAMVAAIGIASAGAWRSIESGGGAQRRPPGTF